MFQRCLRKIFANNVVRWMIDIVYAYLFARTEIDFGLHPYQPLFPKIYAADLADRERLAYNERQRAARRRTAPARALTLNWIIPEPTDAGSGGHMNIFRFVSHLERRGLHNRIYSHVKRHLQDAAAMKRLIVKHYCDIGGAETFDDSRYLQPSDICVATGWDTAYAVFHDTQTRFKVYFIQDFEPAFFGMGADYIFAENTYRMNFFGLCGSPWLKSVAERYGMRAASFKFGYDPGLYRRLPGIQRSERLVAVYVRPRTLRRGLEMLVGAVQNLKQRRPEVEILLFGAKERIENLPFPCEQAGVLDDAGLCRLYNRVSIVLLTSLTNYSIIPVEVMACGALVVDVDMPSIRTVFQDGENIALAQPNPVAMARAVEHYLDHAAERNAIVSHAETLAHAMTWEKIHQQMEADLLAAYYG